MYMNICIIGELFLVMVNNNKPMYMITYTYNHTCFEPVLYLAKYIWDYRIYITVATIKQTAENI